MNYQNSLPISNFFLNSIESQNSVQTHLPHFSHSFSLSTILCLISDSDRDSDREQEIDHKEVEVGGESRGAKEGQQAAKNYRKQ